MCSSEISKDMRKNIRGFSFDFDGCLFNWKYKESFAWLDIIKANKKLLTKLNVENSENHYDQVVAFVGSARQDYRHDQYNSKRYRTHSCYSELIKISKYLDADLDPMLLADIYADLDTGISFNRALDPNYKGEHAEWKWDDSKISVLYAQMHKLALDNPSATIQFDFFDDRLSILGWLHDFYKENATLIPNNLTLRLHCYNLEWRSSENTLENEIKGIGFIDKNFRRTVKDMSDLVRPNCYSVHIDVKESKLKNRKALNVASHTLLSQEGFFTKAPPPKPNNTESLSGKSLA